MLIVGLLSFLLGCDTSAEIEFALFNSANDILNIPVGVEEPLPTIEQELFSTTGAVSIGNITVEPGGGPIGTKHTIIVLVDDDFEQKISRATLKLSSDERGEESYTMNIDSADEGLYMLELISVGSEGEQREDQLQVLLWKNEEEQGGLDLFNSDTGE